MTKEELYKLVDWSKLSRDYKELPLKKVGSRKAKQAYFRKTCYSNSSQNPEVKQKN